MKFEQWGAYADKKDAKDSGDTEQYSYYSSEEEIYRSAASTYYTMYDSMQSASSTSSMRQTERQLTATAQSLMISYETMRLEADTARKMLELYEKEYDLALAGVQAGTATEADVLEAQDYVLTAQSSLASAQSAMESVYDSLCLMVGRDTDGSLTIASIPEADESRISAMNLDTDTRKAIGNNTTLINERHTSAESSTAGSENKKRSVAESEEKLTIKMKQLYQDVLQKKEERDAAKTAYENAGLQKQAADAKYRAGLISQTEYLSAEMEYIGQTASYRAADLAFEQAMDTYDWAVLGLAESEEKRETWGSETRRAEVCTRGWRSQRENHRKVCWKIRGGSGSGLTASGIVWTRRAGPGYPSPPSLLRIFRIFWQII